MTARRARPELGILAALLWSIVVGIPAILTRLGPLGYSVTDHVHALFLFVLSVGLVYWLASRPRGSPTISSAALEPVLATLVSNPLHDLAAKPAEFGTPKHFVGVATPAPAPLRYRSVVTVISYIGSQHPRILFLERAGIKVILAPGQHCTLTAESEVELPEFRLMESDRATQVSFHGPVRLTVAPQGQPVQVLELS